MKADFPRVVEIQTTTACNAGCKVCPHPEVYGGQPSSKMSIDLFRSILEQCRDHQDGLRICPYLNAEPFLDRRMPEFVATINEILPRAEVEISTNLSVLTNQLRERLSGTRIDDLRLSVFGFQQGTHQLLMPGLKFDRVRSNLDSLATDKEFRAVARSISIVMLDHPLLAQEEVEEARDYCRENGWNLHYWGVLDRSKNVADVDNGVWLNAVSGCEQNRPTERLHVRADGRVILCCQDWRDEVVLGDLSKETLLDLWNGPSYLDIRDSIASGRPGAAPDLCRRCAVAIPA